ncbi:hypothetical protein OIU84_006594 [Salix udensis]|uniref:Uncharacterized protein n=1 Tax=Salix udensis TaxID=889485 RepID=A0AAD6P2A1_9ROSI|nr:hypothetical protein OIU84_006594 [Salix udensis]
MDAMTEFSAECEEWIGRSQQTVTVSPKKLKAAVHNLSEAVKKDKHSPLKLEEHASENLEPHKTSRSKVKILGWCHSKLSPLAGSLGGSQFSKGSQNPSLVQDTCLLGTGICLFPGKRRF